MDRKRRRAEVSGRRAQKKVRVEGKAHQFALLYCVHVRFFLFIYSETRVLFLTVPSSTHHERVRVVVIVVVVVVIYFLFPPTVFSFFSLLRH